MEPNFSSLLSTLKNLEINAGAINVILELGARDCNETILFSQYFPKAKIYAFECNPDMIPQCRNRVSGYSNISLIEKAVTDHVGEISFFAINPDQTQTTWMDGNPGASSLFKSSGKYPVENYVQKEVKVPCTDVKSFLLDSGISNIDILWMDIQGAELLALRGFQEKIEKVHIIQTEVEFFEIYEGQPLFNDLDRFLQSQGFLLINRSSLGLYSGDVIYLNSRYYSSIRLLKYKILDRYNRFYINIRQIVQRKLHAFRNKLKTMVSVL